MKKYSTDSDAPCCISALSMNFLLARSLALRIRGRLDHKILRSPMQSGSSYCRSLRLIRCR